MNHLYKLRTPSLLKWVSSNFVDCPKTQLQAVESLFHIAKNPRFYRTRKIVLTENGQKISLATRDEAQAALLEYLHTTRSIEFLDAENMSKNSPHFLEQLLTKVDIDGDIRHSITRYLRYNPVNEFELFFESLGLEPHEYRSLIPHNLMFLCDDDLLLENYHLLCNYGISRNKIGKIYKEAREVFRYDYGVLALKLQAYQELALSQSFMIKVIICSPYLLMGDVNVDFIKVLEILKKAGLDINWIGKHLSEKSSYHWSQLLELLDFLSKIGYTEEQLGGLIGQHPRILFEGSRNSTLKLIGFVLKFGSSMNQIYSMFLQFPVMEIEKFVLNMRQCFLFMNEIKMESHEIGKIVRSHPVLLGSCTMKKTNSLLSYLNVGKKRLCQMIQENPQEMKKWVIGLRVGPLPALGEEQRSKMMKTEFLLDLGYVENSNTMEKALKVFRGKGMDLQERFDCLVKYGLDRKDVCEMAKVSPQILNQSKGVIERKIDFLINDLGFPISTLVVFPSYLSYTRERVKLRTTMYNWLKEQGTVDPKLALSTILACSENLFVRTYVNHHPRGPEVFQNLKKTIYSE